MKYWRTSLNIGGHAYARTHPTEIIAERLDRHTGKWVRTAGLWAETRNTGEWDPCPAEEALQVAELIAADFADAG